MYYPKFQAVVLDIISRYVLVYSGPKFRTVVQDSGQGSARHKIKCNCVLSRELSSSGIVLAHMPPSSVDLKQIPSRE